MKNIISLGLLALFIYALSKSVKQSVVVQLGKVEGPRKEC